MSPRPTVVEMSHVTPSPTGSDVIAGEMAAPMGLTPTPPATPSPPPHQDAGDAPPLPASPPHHPGNHQHHVNNNNNHEEEPILPDLHPFMPFPPYRSDLEDAVPLTKNLPQVLRQVCGTNELRSVRQLRLRVISREMSLQRLCLHVPNLRDLTLDGSCLLSLRDLGCGLVRLRKLRVARCGLDSLDGLFGLMSLRELHAADNEIDDVGPCSALQYIKRIDLSRNRVTDISYVSFLKVCPALKHLSLAGCPAAEDCRYRAEVRRRMPQLLTLDGDPLHRGAARQPVADDDSDDSDDDDDDGDGKGGRANDASPFSSAGEDGGESDADDDDPRTHPGAGDAGSRPSSGRKVMRPLEVILKTPSKEMLPPLQHSMTQLPPLRPLHPLPPIGSQSRPSSAGAGSSARSGTPVVPAAKRPTTGHPKHRKMATADAGDSSTPLAVKAKQRTVADTHRNVLPSPAVQARVKSHSAAVATPQSKPDKGSTHQSAPARGQHGSSNKQSRDPVQPAPRKMSAKVSSVNSSKGGKTVETQPYRTPASKLTHEDCLTLDMEERVKRWTDEILDNPALENLERLSLLAAQADDHCSDEEDLDDPDPGPSTSSRKR